MQGVMLLYVGGDMFYFEDNNFSLAQKEELESLALHVVEDIPTIGEARDDQICSWFVNVAREKLGITLKEIQISFIIRIHRRR